MKMLSFLTVNPGFERSQGGAAPLLRALFLREKKRFDDE
jgi:hypothetical protein